MYFENLNSGNSVEYPHQQHETDPQSTISALIYVNTDGEAVIMLAFQASGRGKRQATHAAGWHRPRRLRGNPSNRRVLHRFNGLQLVNNWRGLVLVCHFSLFKVRKPHGLNAVPDDWTAGPGVVNGEWKIDVKRSKPVLFIDPNTILNGQRQAIEYNE
ncbi:hypothetical protein BJ165DRAFT_1409541 [Panaeolus papilionaceus]|nr:hypothetical protein BJ165DRAFT_1409541 [Panaeolus papilionaceus]